MANTLKYLNHLMQNAGITPACSEEEHQAAEQIAEVFRNHGFEPEIQEFNAATFPKLPSVVIGVILFLGAVLFGIGGVLGVVGLLLCVVGVVWFFLERLGRLKGSFRGAIGLSQNVIAYHKASGPLASPRNRPVVVVAHYDSPRGDLLSRPQLAPLRPWMVKLMPIACTAPAVLAVLNLFPFPGALHVMFWLIAIVCALLPLFNAVCIILNKYVLPYTSGSVCNKSSVAAMLGVMDAVAPYRGENEFPYDIPADQYATTYDDASYYAGDAAAQEAYVGGAGVAGADAAAYGSEPVAAEPGATATMPAVGSDEAADGGATIAMDVRQILEAQREAAAASGEQARAAAEAAAAQAAAVQPEPSEPISAFEGIVATADEDSAAPETLKAAVPSAVRHGEEVIRLLRMLPEDVELTYIYDEPAAPAQMPEAVASVSEPVPSAAPVAQQPTQVAEAVPAASVAGAPADQQAQVASAPAAPVAQPAIPSAQPAAAPQPAATAPAAAPAYAEAPQEQGAEDWRAGVSMAEAAAASGAVSATAASPAPSVGGEQMASPALHEGYRPTPSAEPIAAGQVPAEPSFDVTASVAHAFEDQPDAPYTDDVLLALNAAKAAAEHVDLVAEWGAAPSGTDEAPAAGAYPADAGSEELASAPIVAEAPSIAEAPAEQEGSLTSNGSAFAASPDVPAVEDGVAAPSGTAAWRAIETLDSVEPDGESLVDPFAVSSDAADIESGTTGVWSADQLSADKTLEVPAISDVPPVTAVSDAYRAYMDEDEDDEPLPSLRDYLELLRAEPVEGDIEVAEAVIDGVVEEPEPEVADASASEEAAAIDDEPVQMAGEDAFGAEVGSANEEPVSDDVYAGVSDEGFDDASDWSESEEGFENEDDSYQTEVFDAIGEADQPTSDSSWDEIESVAPPMDAYEPAADGADTATDTEGSIWDDDPAYRPLDTLGQEDVLSYQEEPVSDAGDDVYGASEVEVMEAEIDEGEDPAFVDEAFDQDGPTDAGDEAADEDPGAYQEEEQPVSLAEAKRQEAAAVSPDETFAAIRVPLEETLDEGPATAAYPSFSEEESAPVAGAPAAYEDEGAKTESEMGSVLPVESAAASGHDGIAENQPALDAAALGETRVFSRDQVRNAQDAAIDALMAQIDPSAQAPQQAKPMPASAPTAPDPMASASSMSRASLFDLPDPASLPSDPLGTGSMPAVKQASPRQPLSARVPDLAGDSAPQHPRAASVPDIAVAPAGQGASHAPAPSQAPEGAFEVMTADAAPQQAEKPAKKPGLAARLFGRKKKEEASMSEWLGVGEDFDAKTSGREIGSWDKFEDDSSWKGGAVVLDGGLSDEEITDAVASLGDDELLGHDIWFVATGSSAHGGAGMQAFLDAHRDKLRGVFLINLECVGAGDTSIVLREGTHKPLKGDRRISGLLNQVSADFHTPFSSVDMPFVETDACVAMNMSLRSITVAGVDPSGPRFACAGCDEDEPYNVDPKKVENVANVVTEVIRRS